MRYLMSRQFEHFAAVYELRNLGRASERAGVTQPALTKSIKTLERNIATRLFTRTSKGVAPTRAADALYRRNSAIQQQLRLAELEIGGLFEGRGGKIKIGTGLNWSQERLPVAVAELHKMFPDLQVEICIGSPEVMMPQLIAEQIDVMVAELHEIDIPKSVRTKTLWETKRQPWVRSGHPLTEKSPVRWEMLQDYEWIGFAAGIGGSDFGSSGGHINNLVRKKFQGLGLNPPKFAIESASLNSLRVITASTDLITVLTDELHESSLDYGLRPLDLVDDSWVLRAGVAYLPAIEDIKPFRKLLQLLT